MKSTTADYKTRQLRSLLLVLFLGGLMLVLIFFIALTLIPRTEAFSPVVPSPTEHSLSWAFAKIAKPTYTPSVTERPPSVAVVEIAQPTNTPSVQVSQPLFPTVEIVQPTDAPSPEPVFTATQADPPTSMPPSDNTTPQITMNIVDDAVIPSSVAHTGTTSTMDQGQSYTGGKSILVSISQQHLTAYENGQVVYSFIASTGMHNSTKVGTFSVLDKIPNAYGSTWNIWMPNWLGIYYVGGLEDGIHALPILSNGDRLWSGYLGTPISFGCVVLGVSDSLQLYNWVDIGTPVVIQW
jgi:lipoprotein-anchoring transpeptidase ErfK/SrfK